MLKQLTASLMYPEESLGKKFWEKVYQKIYQTYHITDIPVDTFNKVWVIPEHATIYEHDMGAFVVESRLKVLLEEDYVEAGHARLLQVASTQEHQSQEN